MRTAASPELASAIQAAILTSVLWVPHILQRIRELGPYDAFRDPLHDVPTAAPWAQRAIRAHTNAVENLAVFALLAVAVQVLGAGDRLTATAAQVFVVARAAHYVVYVLGLPWVRTPIFLAGLVAQSILAARLLNLI